MRELRKLHHLFHRPGHRPGRAAGLATVLMLVAAAGCSRPHPPATAADDGYQDHGYRVDPDRHLEFIRDRVVHLLALPDGSLGVSLGPWARVFVIDPRHAQDAAAMQALARRALASGELVHATILDRDPKPKSALRDGGPAGEPARIVRLATTPDPQAAAVRRR